MDLIGSRTGRLRVVAATLMVAVYVSPSLAADADSNKTVDDLTEAQKVIEIESSEKSTALNQSILKNLGDRGLKIVPGTGRLHRSFFREASSFVDKPIIASICKRQSEASKPQSK